MAARRLVLNGLTAEVGAGGEAGGAGSPDSLEFYHELELYRQLLALPPEPPGGAAPPAPPVSRRARTPDPTPSRKCHGESQLQCGRGWRAARGIAPDEPRRSRTPGAARTRPPRAARAASPPAPAVRHARVSRFRIFLNYCEMVIDNNFNCEHSISTDRIIVSDFIVKQ
ncbi:hypothetical protein PYW08_001370 [Mythimna loreyi]|uniref:Uncharacterized protein n=1 Tax=Mythimna loreyi TaxID=667449 RepID=A0ACC2R6F1_9NEOP|nr:hypothetical protein PYW08_001370 [Mythimna loreyi]